MYEGIQVFKSTYKFVRKGRGQADRHTFLLHTHANFVSHLPKNLIGNISQHVGIGLDWPLQPIYKKWQSLFI